MKVVSWRATLVATIGIIVVSGCGSAGTEASDAGFTDPPPGALSAAEEAQPSPLDADEAMSTYDQLAQETVRYENALSVDRTATFEMAQEAFSHYDPALIDGDLAERSIEFHNCRAADSALALPLAPPEEGTIEVEHLSQHRIDESSFALSVVHHIEIPPYGIFSYELTAVVTSQGVGPILEDLYEELSCPVPLSIAGKDLVVAAAELLELDVPDFSEEAVAPTDIIEIAPVGLGSPLELRDGLVFTLQSLGAGRGDAASISYDAVVDNDDPARPNPSFQVVCSATLDQPGWSSSPSELNSRAVGLKLLPDTESFPGDFPICGTPAVLRITHQDSTSLVVAELPIPDEVVESAYNQ